MASSETTSGSAAHAVVSGSQNPIFAANNGFRSVSRTGIGEYVLKANPECVAFDPAVMSPNVSPVGNRNPNAVGAFPVAYWNWLYDPVAKEWTIIVYTNLTDPRANTSDPADLSFSIYVPSST